MYITWINDNTVHMHLYTSPGLREANLSHDTWYKPGIKI